ncbi:MAG: hypothetical protein CMD74_00535 [Gammaproteobacteria bacterium]|nr:hypothetical protein [Gammaproteobacteria bacterium]
MLQILPKDISKEALEGIIQAYVLREGTDYGVQAHTFPEKCLQVMDQISRGEVKLWYDEGTQSVELILSRD